MKLTHLKWIYNPIFLTYIFSSAFLLIPNNKSYLLLFVGYTMGLFILSKFSLIESLFSTLLLSLPFERGIRGWFIEVVPPGPFRWTPGYEFYLGLTPKIIILILLLLLFFVNKVKNKSLGLESSVLFLFLIFSIISSLLNVNNFIALPGLFRIISFIGVYLIGSQLFNNANIKKIYPHILIGSLLSFGIIGILQLIHRQPFGLFLEDTGVSGQLGYITTDSVPVYRVSGFTGHPTYFGSLLSILIPITLGFFITNLKKGMAILEIIPLASLLLGFLCLLGTFSRSGWVAVGLVLILFFWKSKNFKLSVKTLFVGITVIPILAVATFFLPLVFYRIQSFSDILSQENGVGRLNLIFQASDMIKQFPLFGVGLNHFTEIMAQNSLPPEIRSFLYPVHNTFILFLAELGIPAGILFIFFVFLAFKNTWAISQKNWINFGLWTGSATYILNSQFHTLFNLDPTFEIFSAILAYLTVL